MFGILRRKIRTQKVLTNCAYVSWRNGSNDSKRTKPKVDVADLLKSLEKPIEEPKTDRRVLQNLLNNDSVKRKDETNRVAKKLSEKRHKEGEKFLFQESSSLKRNIVKLEAVEHKSSDDLDFLEYTPEKKTLTALEPQPFQVTQLKNEIDESDDTRSVTKLMSALIDEIDNELPDTEVKLQALMKAMSQRKPAQVDLIEQDNSPPRDYLKKQQGIRRQAFSLTRGETTNLFADLQSVRSDFNEKSIFNLHEKLWYDELNNLLPENLPRNSFEVMMLGIDRQWQFPIDNEQDMKTEENTSFEEHVFLDHYLDEFPKDKPTRKFMELVITGLQQNPYLSVHEKIDRIYWFRDYFDKLPEEELSM